MRQRSFSFVILATAVSAVVLAQQVSLPAPLASHAKSMVEAASLTGTATVQPLPGEPMTVSFWFSKPNKYRIETNEKTWVCDGQNVTTYDKASNTYSVATMDSPVPKSVEVWAWASFFEKEPYKYAQAAKTGSKRTVKGHKVTEVTVGWKDGEETLGTAYLDENNVCWGFNYKSGEKEWVVLAEQVTKGDAALENSKFVFTAPAGATKAEMVAKATFASVSKVFQRNCMPCHSSNQQAGGVDLSSFDTLMQANIVVSGKPEESELYKVISGPRPSMPKNRSKLTEADQKLISEWIKDGAKGS
ncbi:MAG: hypothetical protein JSS66_14220 [Armatimonadetes bacterium]|nr:hypothetical protein [Armatimonadota bacterium]